MLLVVIRHAIALTREEFARTGRDDALRPLSAEGREKMRGNAAGLRQLVPQLDLLAASPLTRAQQTARIVAKRYPGVRQVTTSSLEPESELASFGEWLRARRADVVAVVGHEPHLGSLVTWLLTGVEDSRIPLKKGAACLLEFRATPEAGSARLRWALTPSQLRRLGD